MSSINVLAILPNSIKKWAKPFTDAVLGTLKQISGVPFQRHFGMVSADMSDAELEQIKDKIIRADIFIFVLSPEYVLFEQTRGLLQLVKAREINIKAEHKIVFSILRETCKIPAYFLQKPLYDFIGVSFNTPSFKNKYVKLIKDIVSAIKASDSLYKKKTQTFQLETQQKEEATAIPISVEPADANAQETQKPVIEKQQIVEPPIAMEQPIIQKPMEIESAKSIDASEADDEFEPVDFLEPFNNQALPIADDIPEAPQIEEPSQQDQAYFSAPPISEPIASEEIQEESEETTETVEETEESTETVEETEETTETVEETEESTETVEETEEEVEEKIVIEEIPDADMSSETPVIDSETEEPEKEKNIDVDESEIESEETIIDITDELENSSLEDFDFDNFDMDESEDDGETLPEKETPQHEESTEAESPVEQNELIEDNIISDLNSNAENDIVPESLDDPEREELKVELKQFDDQSQDNDWDSFVEEESNKTEIEKLNMHTEPKIKNEKPVVEDAEDEELEPWTGSASTYEDPDVKKKKKTESFEKKKVGTRKLKKPTTEHLKNGANSKSKKNRPKKRRKQLKTDADIISGEIQNDGVDVLEELGIDIDNVSDTPEPVVSKKKDTATIDELLKQEALSMEDDLSFDNELVLEDAEDESIEDESVGAEFGMSQIKLSNEPEISEKSDDKDIIDELELGDELDKRDIPKGNCTLFMNKVPENRKGEAIKLIQEMNDMEESEIEKLLARIVVPVLKDVFVEQAEKALDKLKRSGFNGRIRKT
ncbi:MAG: hypothetical protein K8S87_10440 [Planctomycetes bacterium]|nr:hypothetical protein [Planctomycetota bacterium]